MSPKEQAISDYQEGVYDPVAPMSFTHDQKSVYYKEFLALVNAENTRMREELAGNV